MRWDTFLGRVGESGSLEPLFDSMAPAGSTVSGEPPGTVVAIAADGRRRLLAPGGSAVASVWALAAEHGLDPRYPEAVHREVVAGLEAPGLDDPALVDRRELPFVTIDGASARDLDQALFVEALPGGGWRIDYALADAAHYAPPGSALFAESLRRGASYYLPDLTVPMLPRAFSEGLVSLNPDVDRRAVLFRLTTDARGRRIDTRVERALVRSRGKLSFAAVEAYYEGETADWSSAVSASLDALRSVGEARMVLAEERDIVRYRRAEVRIGTDDPLGFVTRADLRAEVERYNEQVSLLCNVAGAELLAAAEGVPFVEPIFRVHPAPPAERVADLERFLAALAESHDLDSDAWVWHRAGGRPLSTFLDELPAAGPEGRVAAAIHRQAVMLNVRSTFQESPESHHGVGADVYARFTSPMREVVGIHLHHELFEMLAEEGGIDPERRERVALAANRAKMVQKNLENGANRLVLEQILGRAEREGQALRGTLMGLDRGKAYVRLDEPPIDVKAYLRHQARFGGEVHIERDGAELYRGPHRVLRVGDAVHLRVHSPEESRWVLELSPAPPIE